MQSPAVGAGMTTRAVGPRNAPPCRGCRNDSQGRGSNHRIGLLWPDEVQGAFEENIVQVSKIENQGRKTRVMKDQVDWRGKTINESREAIGRRKRVTLSWVPE